MKRVFAAVVVSILTMGTYVPSDAERARWTMHDMMSWKVVFDAYYTDHKEYPHVATVDEARAIGEPIYINAAPMHDAWGNPYRIEADGKTFRIVSAGADGKFDPSTWSVAGKKLPFDADAVVTNEGRWLFRAWDFQ